MAISSNASSPFTFSNKFRLPQIFSCHVAYLKVEFTIIGHLELDSSCKNPKSNIRKKISSVTQIAQADVKYSKTESLNVNFSKPNFSFWNRSSFLRLGWCFAQLSQQINSRTKLKLCAPCMWHIFAYTHNI